MNPLDHHFHRTQARKAGPSKPQTSPRPEPVLTGHVTNADRLAAYAERRAQYRDYTAMAVRRGQALAEKWQAEDEQMVADRERRDAA